MLNGSRRHTTVIEGAAGNVGSAFNSCRSRPEKYVFLTRLVERSEWAKQPETLRVKSSSDEAW